VLSHPLVRRAGRVALGALPAPARRWVRMRRRDAATRVVTLDELDGVLEEAAHCFSRSEDDGRAFLAGIRMAPPPWPPDPFTSAYRRWAWDLYATVSGRGSYSVEHEASPFDFDEALRRPFPYATGSASVVGTDLVARGRIVAALGLTVPARVVEFGPGWGNLTADLSTMGHDVTAVEVDEGFCRLIAARAPSAQVVRSGMLEFASAFAVVPTDEPFDAAVFYESFHHCADHLQMLELLHALVRADGVVVFGAEPVDALAYPWGPRLDGLSLWSTRRYGWLELGFDERYFADVLHRTGWSLEAVGAPGESPPVFVARSLRAEETVGGMVLP